MGLILPNSPDWAYCTDNFPSNLSATAFGAEVTTGISNADGSAVSLFSSALTHDVEYLRLMINGELPLGENNDILMSVLIDPAGGSSWADFIPYLIAGGVNDIKVSGSDPAGLSCIYDFPIWVPAGASLGLQARSAAGATSTLYVSALAYGGNRNPASWWAGQRVTNVGINAASSTGTAHTTGGSGSFSSWTNFGSTLPQNCGALQWGVNGQASSFYSADSFQYEFGVGGQRIGAPLFRLLTSSEAGFWVSTGPIFKSLASGSQLQVRGSASSTARTLGVAAYAVH